MNTNDSDSIEELMNAGFAALTEENYDDAIRIGRQLIAMHHSSGFEIAGLAYQRQGKISEALELLEEGVNKAAPVWVLWKLLGDSYSDAERFEDAENAYQTALTKNKADADLIHLNRGIAFHRQEKWDDAENALFPVKSKGLRRRALAELIHIAANAGKPAVAAERALALINQRPCEGEETSSHETSSVLSAVALGLLHGKDLVRAKEYALLAAELNPANSEALWIVRKIHGKPARNAVGFALILNGVLDEDVNDKKKPPFLRTIQVAAPDIDSALDYAREFFPENLRQTLRVDEVNEFDASEIQLEGVHSVSGYFIYPRVTE